MTKLHSYTDEQLTFLKENVKGRKYKELTELFNAHFGLNLTHTQISGTLKRNNLTNGRDCTFKKGQIPFNKGMKGVNFGGENGKKTQFKKGQTPINYRPVGSERINVDGYIEIKVADPHKWLSKHRVVWEKHHGPIPKNHAVIFGDGNPLNYDINNLILVSRKQLLIMNKNNLIQNHAELTRTGVIVADIYSELNKRKSGRK